MAELVYLLLLCTAGTLVRPSTAQSSGASGSMILITNLSIQPSPATVFQGQTVVFNCTYSESVSARVAWLRDGRPWAGSQTSDLPNGGRLRVENVTRELNGSEVTCVVDVGGGSTAEASTHLTVLDGAPRILVPPANTTIRFQMSFSLTCLVAGYPAPSVTWYLNTGVFNPAFLSGVSYDREEGQLRIDQATDDFHGEYVCEARNKHGVVTSEPASVRVLVPPELSHVPESQEVENGSRVIFTCEARGYPAPSISWTHNMHPVIGSARVRIASRGNLEINNVMLTDAGVYRCAAANELGRIQSDTATLIVWVHPGFVYHPEPTSVDLGQPATIRCVAFALPAPEYAWQHDGRLVEEEGGRVRVVNGSLVISEVRREDAGSYVCLVENSRGQIGSVPVQLTVYAAPSKPDWVELFDVGPTWLKLRWSPISSAQPAVLHFLVEYRLSFHSNWTLATQTSQFRANISGLYPNAPYALRVRGESPKGIGEPSDTVENRTLFGVPPPTLPGSPVNISLTSLSSSISLRWDIPAIIRRTSYTGTHVRVLLPSGHERELVALETSVTVPGLQPATVYRLQLAIVFAGGYVGVEASTDGMTEEDVPGDAPILTVTASTATTLTLAWSPPSLPNGHITHYSIQYRPEGYRDTQEKIVSGGERSVQLEGLSPYTNYSLSISASTAVGTGPSSRRLLAATEEDVPDVAPTGVTLQPINSTAIRLSWQPLEEASVPGVLTQYTVVYNRKGGEERHQKMVNVTARSEDGTSVVLDGLNPFTLYHVKVAAATSAGVGTFSGPAFARTNGDVPVTDVNITSIVAIGPTRLLVEWAQPPPNLLHAHLDNITYIIVFQPADRSEDPLEEEEVYVGNSSNLTYTITNLTAYTTYSVAMAVKNDHGRGPFGQFVNATTGEGVPTEAPSGLAVIPMSSTSLTVSWQPLADEDVPGILVNYTIRYNQLHHGGHPLEVQVDANRTEYVLEGLLKYTVYKVCVAGVTVAGVGTFSQVVESRTLSDLPDVQLVGVSLTPSCPPPSLTVSWGEPEAADFRKQLNGPEESAEYVFNVSAVGEEGFVVTVNRSELAGSTSYNLSNLTRNTSYTVTVSVMNIEGVGPSSVPAENSTLEEGVPSVPLNLTLAPTNAGNMSVFWAPPIDLQGSPVYIVHYREVGEGGGWRRADVLEGQLRAELSGLKPFTNYTVQVWAETSCGRGPAVQRTELSLEDPPSAPVGAAISLATPTSLLVQWRDSQHPNGIIKHYMVYCPGAAAVPVTTSTSGVYSHTCVGLQEDSMHSVRVAGVNGAGEGEVATATGRTACTGLTPVVRNVGTDIVVMVTTACSNQPLFLLVVVQEVGTPPVQSLDSYSLDELIELTEEYARQRGRRQTGQGGVYIAANVSSTVLEGEGLTLGDGMEYGEYQNYPLVEDVSYHVGFRGTLPGSDSAVSAANEDPFSLPLDDEDDGGSDFPIILVASGGAAGVLVVVILLVIVCVCCCCCCSCSADKDGGGAPLERGPSIRISRRGRTLDPAEEFRHTHTTDVLEAHPPVPVSEFVNKLLVMRANDNQLFLEEFGSIEMNPRFPTDAASLAHNQPKNRYNNILPYDHSRVKLNHMRGQHGSDYVNASYVSGYMKPKAYIATQGPLPETTSDFWRMVWEENSRSIVMLTNTHERGKVKCEVYWPREVGSSGVYGLMEVTLKYYTHLADYTIRTFSVQKIGSGKDSREVRQFHFTSWPDHGVPEYATAMLALMRHVRSYHPGGVGPVVVHCSAGVGRSGTFIVLDSMLDRIKAGGDTVDIYGHVTLLRAQRNYMVQTEDQYFFIHEALAEALVCGDTEVPLDELPGYACQLCRVIADDEQDTTHIEMEFKRLAVDKTDPHRFASASKDPNKSKNRYVNVLPFETNRVYLQFIRGVDGSDYINASYIDSYHYQRAFIATQGPLQRTVVDFWRMVWQYNCPVVVMLTQLTEKGMERSARYWPYEVLRSETYGSYTVEMTAERNSGHYVYRDLHITDPESGQKRQVRHYQFMSWPEVGVPASTHIFVDFIREVQKLYATLNTKAPIAVHCSNGIGRTGVFIALHIILERMLTEGMVDVFQTVKNLRIQRPAMVQTLEQYQFCYDASVDYVHSSDLLLIHQQLQRQPTHRRTGSNTSEVRRKSRGNSPARTDSFNRKRSSKNLELSQMGNGSHIIRESDQTSTFGRQRTASPSQGSHSPSSSSVGLHPSPRVSGIATGETGSCSPRVSTNDSQMGLLSGTELSQLATHSWSHGAAASDTQTLSFPSGSQS